MDQKKLDGTRLKRPWFGRVWGRLWPWSLMGWLWTIIFVCLMMVLIAHIKSLESSHDPTADRWWLAFPVLVIVFLVVAYRNSRKL